MIEKSIQEQIALRKLTILKSFKDTTEKPLVTLKQLRNETDCPIYSEEVVKGYINEVNATIKDVNERARIQEHLNSLEAMTVVNDLGFRQTVYLDKGHMDFDGSSSGGSRQGLVKKQITDKAGRKTSRWVRQGEDEKGTDKPAQAGEEDAKNPTDKKEQKQIGEVGQGGNKGVEDHAKETSTEDLKRYLQNNPDGEHAEHARKELEARGESMDDNEEPMDYNNPDSVKFALDAHPDKDAIIDFAITHGVPIGQAMKLHDATKQDHSETHAAIDEAQNSLNALKEKTGHPETQQRNEDDYEEDELDNAEYGVMMYGDEILNGTVDADSVGDFTMALGEVVQFTPDIEKQAHDVFRKIESTIGKDKFLEIIENETSDEELLANLEMMYDEANSEGGSEDDDSEEGDFINPGNTKKQAQDRKEFEKENEGGEKGDVDNKVDSKESQKDFSNGDDFFDAYYQMYEEGGDGFVEDINDYIMENDLGMDGRDQEQEFNSLSPKHKKNLVAMMKEAFDSFTRYQKGQ